LAIRSGIKRRPKIKYREHFLKIAKEEIAALHEGNYARYRFLASEFKDWQKRKI
jgi:hypothetical protein